LNIYYCHAISTPTHTCTLSIQRAHHNTHHNPHNTQHYTHTHDNTPHTQQHTHNNTNTIQHTTTHNNNNNNTRNTTQQNKHVECVIVLTLYLLGFHADDTHKQITHTQIHIHFTSLKAGLMFLVLACV